jgi:hypothetical protein
MKNFKNFILFNQPVYKDNITIDEAIRKLISFQVDRSLKLRLRKNIEQSEYEVDWMCYECKTGILVNVKDLLNGDDDIVASDFMCDKHKSTKVNQKLSISWIRYENVFHKKLKTIIQQNTNIQ